MDMKRCPAGRTGLPVSAYHTCATRAIKTTAKKTLPINAHLPTDTLRLSQKGPHSHSDFHTVQIAAASYFNLYSASRLLLHCARLQHERQRSTAQEECTECVGRFCAHSVGRIAPSAQCRGRPCGCCRYAAAPRAQTTSALPDWRAAARQEYGSGKAQCRR